MAEKSGTGECRFCGQSVIVEDGAEMTAPQLEEASTMLCGCDAAIKYQQEKNRRAVAKQRIDELFGEDAGEYRQPETVREIMLNSVDAICDKKMKSITITIRTGLRCRIMKMAKDKIKVVREVSDNNEFVQ